MNFFEIITPFLLASIGGLYTEYSGTTNVALEGYITISAFIFITITKLTNSILLGFCLTIGIILIISFIHSSLTIKLKANPIITGLAVNMGFYGLISALSYKIFKTKGVISLDYPNIETMPIKILAILLPFITLFIISKTRYGLRLRVRGLSKKSLIYSRINADYYRLTAMMISAILSGLGGIFLGMELRSFIPNIGSGRGWISLVIIYLGRKNPIGILIGCGIFSVAQIFSNYSQNHNVPSEFILALPYFLTLIALIISMRKKTINNR
ncbi:MAG: ABC transporter permease [Spirochaetales bacterium]|nr:ABC transporter permease [Spirochaetales bacterium]